MEELDAGECWRLLGESAVGRLAWCEADGPVLIPVNHAVADGVLLLRTAPWTSLVTHVDDSPVAYEVDGSDPGTRTGWSVLVRGRAEVSYAADRHATDPQTPGLPGPDPWPDRSHAALVRIHPDEVTGRRLTR